MRYFEQLQGIKRAASMMFNAHDFAGTGRFQSIFAALEGKYVPRKTIQDLHAMGFKTVAGSATPWTKHEEATLKRAIALVAVDPSVTDGYAKTEKWIAWRELGGSRTENAVVKKMRELLRVEGTCAY